MTRPDNVDEKAYTHTPDSRVPLTSRGLDQAALAGRMLHQLIGPEANVYFYVSPYTRAKQTLARVLEALPPTCEAGSVGFLKVWAGLGGLLGPPDESLVASHRHPLPGARRPPPPRGEDF